MNRLIKNTATISVLTLLSRILGVIRDAGIAMVFGTSLHTDAFFLAFKPFDLVRKLFSEGILSISFIPEFSRVISEKGRNDAVIMAMSFLGFLSLTASVIILLAFMFSGSAVALIAPGFASGSSAAALTETLFVIMLPYLWCTMIIALCMGVLNTLGHFVIPALAPVLFNATIISFTLLACNYFDLPVTGLAAGVFAGGCVQVLIQIPVMWRYKMFNLKSFRLFHPSLIRVFKIMIPTMIGAASFQINIMVASFFASQLKEGSVSFIYFADRLVQFPLALFAVSVSTVLLPDFAHKASTNKLEQIAPLFTKGVRLVFYITFPAMAGLMALDQEIVRFLFGQGRFDTYAVNQTASCLFWLVTGLWAYTGTRIYVTLFFALSNTAIPFLAGVISVSLNFLAGLFFATQLGLTGLAMVVALSSAAGFFILFFNTPRALAMAGSDIVVSACRALFLSGIMGILVELSVPFIFSFSPGKIGTGAGLFGGILLGILIYAGLSIAVACPEFKLLAQGLNQKK